MRVIDMFEFEVVVIGFVFVIGGFVVRVVVWTTVWFFCIFVGGEVGILVELVRGDGFVGLDV